MEKKVDLRILKTYKALYEAFSMLLEEKKFEDITVNELCQRAMVRRATFYKHFADKYEYFAFFIREIQARFNEDIKEYSHDQTPYSYYIYLFKNSVKLLKEHEKIVDSLIKSSVFPTLLEIISDEIYRNVLLTMKEIVKAGTPLAVSPNILASFYTGGIMQSVRYWVSTQNGISEEEMIGEVEKILNLFAIGNEKIIEQYAKN